MVGSDIAEFEEYALNENPDVLRKKYYKLWHGVEPPENL